jgi:heat shock protein HtpX
MQIAKTIFLFIAVNVVVMMTISVLLSIFHVQPYLDQYGLNIPSLAAFCLIWGMSGSLISLAMSRAIAKWSYGIQLINPENCSGRERWLVQTVRRLCERVGINTLPEIGIYDSQEANAFATGPTKSRALVACSSGLFNLMNDDEIEGVLGHEISHVANGDMVTITLLQGIVNTFAMFAANFIAYILVRGSRSKDNDGFAGSGGFYLIRIVLELVFFSIGGLLVAFFNRHRECRADDGGADLAGKNKMIGALEALQRTYDYIDPKAQPAAQTMKISARPHGMWMMLWATHPPLAERIARLRNKVG